MSQWDGEGGGGRRRRCCYGDGLRRRIRGGGPHKMWTPSVKLWWLMGSLRYLLHYPPPLSSATINLPFTSLSLPTITLSVLLPLFFPSPKIPPFLISSDLGLSSFQSFRKRFRFFVFLKLPIWKNQKYFNSNNKKQSRCSCNSDDEPECGSFRFQIRHQHVHHRRRLQLLHFRHYCSETATSSRRLHLHFP